MYEFKDNDQRLVSSFRKLEYTNSTTVIHVQELMKYLRNNFKLDWKGYHGAPHWSRVNLNGLLLADAENARKDVITLFAFLHDHMREHDDHDTEHGALAVENAKKLRNEYFKIDDTGFDLLCEAMLLHSNGVIHGDITVQCCYDADRLDLGRVGIRPDPRYLCTNTAKDERFLQAAFLRSTRK